LKKEYTRRLRIMLKSKNRIATFGTLAVPILRHSLVSLIGD
jgi:hypothetical protein